MQVAAMKPVALDAQSVDQKILDEEYKTSFILLVYFPIILEHYDIRFVHRKCHLISHSNR